MAESCDGSSPARNIRRSVSRHEMPASIKMLAPELARIAVLPRDPEASTVMRTMQRRIVEKPVDRGVIIQLTSTGKDPEPRYAGPPMRLVGESCSHRERMRQEFLDGFSKLGM